MSQQRRTDGFDYKGSFNIAYFLFVAQATCITPITRIKFGGEALGFPGLGALILLCFWVMATGSFEIQDYIVVWFIAMVLQRIKTLIDGWRGNHQHSGYGGYPWLTAWLVRHERLAKFMEGASVFGGGMFMDDIAWPFGHLLMASGGSIVVLEAIHWHYHHKRESAARDAVIEMQQMGNPLTGKPIWQ